jgi:hypothetical protein
MAKKNKTGAGGPIESVRAYAFTVPIAYRP